MGLGFSRQDIEDEPVEPEVVNDHNIQIDEDIDSLEVNYGIVQGIHKAQQVCHYGS